VGGPEDPGPTDTDMLIRVEKHILRNSHDSFLR
jgi:hypothetical protein